MRHLSPEQLQSHIADSAEPLTLLDVREPWEFDVCRIAGSRHIPMSQLVARLGELDPQAPTVVICHHGVRSQRVAAYLEHHGFSDVMNLAGGVDAWARSVDPAMPLY